MTSHSPHSLSLGPAMLDLASTEMTAEERALLTHPLVGGVILFTRNFASVAQVSRLTAEIHALRDPPLLIAVDHEGGRVQRFREGFTRLPAMRALGTLWDRDHEAAWQAACATGYVLAAELRAVGVDLSFAPVLDLEYGFSTVIGDRAFHASPEAAAELAGALIDGLREAGMANVGKHFPGHGFVAADSHLAVPVDNRSFADIAANDLRPYRLLGNKLAAVMPAHVIFDAVDARPAGFSPYWLKQVLRTDLGFDGAIFSDDLSMEGASLAGGIVDRANAALEAGCDMVLVCNAAEGARSLLQSWRPDISAGSACRLVRLMPTGSAKSFAELNREATYLAARDRVASLVVD